jgi:bifunctional non-homologous end joining protein LigD
MKTRYMPMLSRSAPGPFNGDEWFFEIKWDGVRAIAYVNDDLSLRSRNDRELAGQFPELSELLTLAPGTVLDGEIVAMTKGKPDIQALLGRLQEHPGRLSPQRASVPVTYIVFDILKKGKKSLLDLPLTERRKILKQAVREGTHVILSVPVESRGVDYFHAAIAQGLEGVMAKRKDSLYEPGLRSPAWLRIKRRKTCDCVIAGYTQGQGSRSQTFGALILGLYENVSDSSLSPSITNDSKMILPSVSRNIVKPGKRLVYIGKVGTGFSDRDLSVLSDSFSATTTSIPQLPDVGQSEKIIWLKPFIVCEVAYQQVTRDKKLRIPRFIRVRPDKKPEDCTTDQLTQEQVHPEHTGLVVPNKDHSNELKSDDTVNVPINRGTGKNNYQPPGSTTKLILRNYHARRNFSKTSEPEGITTMSKEENHFIIQEHHARHLHYDLRLERDGVLKSWAVPKGIPEKSGEKHLAVAVEDHPVDYLHFEGTIPDGEYGAGTVSIWDEGTYDAKHWDTDKIEIILHGRRLNGIYVLVRFKRAGKDEWLIFRAEDK